MFYFNEIFRFISRNLSYHVYAQHNTFFNSKGQLFSECLFWCLKFSKNAKKVLQISALESKKWWNHKTKAHFNDLDTNYVHIMYRKVSLFYWFDHFDQCQIFRWFFGKFMIIKKTFWNQLTFNSKIQIYRIIRVWKNS